MPSWQLCPIPCFPVPPHLPLFSFLCLSNHGGSHPAPPCWLEHTARLQKRQAWLGDGRARRQPDRKGGPPVQISTERHCGNSWPQPGAESGRGERSQIPASLSSSLLALPACPHPSSTQQHPSSNLGAAEVDLAPPLPPPACSSGAARPARRAKAENPYPSPPRRQRVGTP